MISYEWHHQELAKEIYDHLDKGKIPLWMDINGGMKTDLIACMAEGVQEAAAVMQGFQLDARP